MSGLVETMALRQVDRAPALMPGYGLGGILERAVADPEGGPGLLPAFRVADRRCPDETWMHRALMCSMASAGITNPNPAVGCVLVRDGTIIAEGATESYGARHAERVAFDQVRDHSALAGATAYVTLEPCTHQGQQPPCVDLVEQSPLKRVVIAAADPNPLVNGQGIARLRASGKDVTYGPLRAEAIAWNFSFHAHQILKRPVIIAKWAQTLNGQLADGSGRSKWISGVAARRYAHWLRRRYDAVLVGAGTVLADFPLLTARGPWVPDEKPPVRIIVDLNGRCFRVDPATQARLKATTLAEDGSTILVAGAGFERGADPEWIRWLASRPNIRTVVMPSSEFCATAVLDSLSGAEIEGHIGRPLQSVMVEGGPQMLTRFVADGLVDLIHVFIAPSFVSGSEFQVGGRPYAEAPLRHGGGLACDLPDEPRHAVMASTQIGPDILLELVPVDLCCQIFAENLDQSRGHAPAAVGI